MLWANTTHIQDNSTFRNVSYKKKDSRTKDCIRELNVDLKHNYNRKKNHGF